MTARQLFEYALIESNKAHAPSLILEDYNYFINKAINQYINKVYNLYDINQQKTDDIRVLKSTAVLIPAINSEFTTEALLNKTYEVDLPDDYLHILNCIVEYNVKSNFKCYDAGDKLQFGAIRLTADMFSQIINNYYMRPHYKRPYYYINNVSSDTTYPINETPTLITPSGTVTNYFLINFGTPGASTIIVVKQGTSTTFTYNASPVTSLEFNNITSLQTKLNLIGIPSTIIDTTLLIDNAYGLGITSVTETGTYLTISSGTITDTTSLVQRVASNRYGNRSKVRMEIRYGKDNTLFELSKVYVDYLRSPQFIRLTQEQVDEVEDKSQILEFPDYVCQEIVNELIKLLMENASDPRLQSHIPINQSIANPAQEQQKR